MALIDTLGEIPVPRRGNVQRQELLDILAIALVASVCGAESCVDFAEFAEDREALFREFLSLKNGLPSHDTFCRVFRLLDPAAFGRAFESSSTISAPPATGCSPSTARRCAAPSTAPRAARRCTSSPPSAPARGSPSPRRRCPRARTRPSPPARCSRPWRSTASRHRRRDARPRRHRAGHPRPRRRLSLRAQGQPPGDAARGRGLLRRSARAARRLRDHRRRPRPRRDPPPPGNPFHRLALLRPPLPGRAPHPGPRHPRLRRGDPHRGRPAPPRSIRYYISSAHPHPRAPSPAPSAATGRSRTACTGCSTSPSTRTAPATAATTAPRTSPSSAASASTSSTRPGRRCPSPANEAIRMVRRLRKNHHRPNAIALFARHACT